MKDLSVLSAHGLVKQTARHLPTALLAPLRRARARQSFTGSRDYWERRYSIGDDSGRGSYGDLAQFKAEVVNRFVKQQGSRLIIDFGCGDGNQLSYADYPAYIGLDVAPTAIAMCSRRFSNDPTKSFFLYSTENFFDRHRLFVADLTVSLDVAFHLVEDAIYETYMEQLFAASTRHVIIYSSNEEKVDLAAHVRHRHVTRWIEDHMTQWQMIDQVQNPHRGQTGAVADFYIFERDNG